MYHFLFLFLKGFVFWVKFDTVESINKIPEDKNNLTDFCPICSKPLGTKSTRAHKLHDLTEHPRTDKQKVEELKRAGGIIWIIAIYVGLIFGVFYGIGFFTGEYAVYPDSTEEFIKSCDTIRLYYNSLLLNKTNITPKLIDEIKEGMGVCFEDITLTKPMRITLAERYVNMTK